MLDDVAKKTEEEEGTCGSIDLCRASKWLEQFLKDKGSTNEGGEKEKGENENGEKEKGADIKVEKAEGEAGEAPLMHIDVESEA